MKTLISIISTYFLQLERKINEPLALLLFGAEANQDFDDIPLPSEARPVAEKPKAKERTRRKKRRSIQLQLLLTKGVKRALLMLVLGVEKSLQMFWHSKAVQIEHNSYR
jgi:hypothetical protein